ncbi:MAG: hypothetical protein U0183_06620 [Polyangiaceae bacterium]
MSTTTEARDERALDDPQEKAAAKVRAQLERYETWVGDLEARRAELLRNKPFYTKVFLAFPPLSLAHAVQEPEGGCVYLLASEVGLSSGGSSFFSSAMRFFASFRPMR